MLGEVENVASRVGIIRNGSIVEVATLQKLKGLALKRVELLFDSPVDKAILRTQIPADIVAEVSIDNSRAHFLVNRNDLRALLECLREVQFTDLYITGPDLEDIFLKYYHGDSASVQEEKRITSEVS